MALAQTQPHIDAADERGHQEAEAEWKKYMGCIDKAGSAFHFFHDVKRKEFSQQLTSTCTFCNLHVTSTGATRLVQHLVKCITAPKEVKKAFEELESRKAVKRKIKEQQLESALQEEELKKQKVVNNLVQQGIKQSVKVACAQQADRAIANFFYANALPFQAASSEVDSY